MLTKFYFHGGPLDGAQRATGGCNPWRAKTKRGVFTYVLHTYAAGDRRYGIYALRGAPRPPVPVVQQLVARFMLETMGVPMPAGIGVRA